MGLTNFPNGISSFGIPVIGSGGGLPATSGSYLFVDYTNGDDGVSVKSNSVGRPFKTVAQAYSKATTNKDDVIVLMGNATHTLTEMLNVSKNRVHFVGMDGSGGRLYGQNAKVSLGVTTAATDIATVQNTGTRNTFRNIKFINDNTVTEGIYCFVEAGEYTGIDLCEIYKSTDMDQTGAAELVMNGDSAQITNSTIGSLATARSGAVIRPNVLVTNGIVSGKVARDVYFGNCRFWINASNSANRFVYGANAADVERVMEFDQCAFINNGASAAIPAQNVAFGSSLTVGMVLLNRCTSLNASTAMSTTTGVFVDGAAPTAGTSGIAVQAS